VALQESDFNQSNWLLIGRPLLHRLEDTCAIPDIQHGFRPSKLCQSAVLNKVLTFEIHRYRKQTLAYIENDALGCYDRIVNPLALLFLRILGLAPTFIASLATTWETTYHRIKTIYGISNHQYTNSSQYLLYGPGQGSTIGPFLWLLCFILIFSSLSPNAPKITIISADKRTKVDFIGEAFVDDTGLGTNQTSSEQLQLQSYRNQQEIVQNLVTLAQEWERLLYSTGGALSLQKCFWFTLSWRWSKGKAVLETQETSPASFHMTSGGQQETTLIPRIEPTTSFRTLGVYLTPRGSSRGSMITLQEAAIQYAATITGTHLSCQEALTSYVQYVHPTQA
jgi:hypothetical protein